MVARRKDQVEGDPRQLFWDQAGHDLRQPVQSLQLLAQVFARSADGEPLRQGADHMRRVVEDLAQMHEALLRVSRLEAGHAVPARRAVDIQRLAREVVRDIAETARAKNLELRLGAFRASPEADSEWLRVILRGILLIAIRHSEGNEVLIGGRGSRQAFAITADFEGRDISGREAASVFVETAESVGVTGERRAILGPGYLGHLCGLLGYRLDLGRGRLGRQRIRLTIPRGPAAS